MFKLSKKADYGLIAVKHLAMHRTQHACSANEIAEEYGISVTLMAKVLQKLARFGSFGVVDGTVSQADGRVLASGQVKVWRQGETSPKAMAT